MTKLKVSSLTNKQLDWLVSCLEGNTLDIYRWLNTRERYKDFWYTTSWSQGGPIVEKELINLITTRSMTMTSEKIQAALAAIVESVKQMGAERFRAELDARGPGPLAHAFAEIEAFASEYMGGGVWIDQHGPTP